MSARRERQSGHPGVLATRVRGVHYDEGITVPADGTVGYAPGAMFLLTVVPSGMYTNNGTYLSSAFQLVVSASGVTPIMATAVLVLVSAANHAGRTIVMSKTAGETFSLEASTGSGAKYRFVVGMVPTTGTYQIMKGGTDRFRGSLPVSVPGTTWATANTGETFAPTGGNNMSLDGAQRGGATIGDWVEVEDIKSGNWQVQGWLTATGLPLTPFS